MSIEHLGQQIPLDLQFTNENGQLESIGSYFNQGRPVILVLAYYECPMLCTLVLNGVANGVNQLDWTFGDQYQILTISINPVETPQLAAAKRVNLLNTITKKKNDNGWRFFVGSQDQIARLADAIGFKYYYDKTQKIRPSRGRDYSGPKRKNFPLPVWGGIQEAGFAVGIAGGIRGQNWQLDR